MRKTPSSSRNRNGNVKKNIKKRKQFSPRNFLECQSITHVVGFPPQHELVTNPVVSDFVKELFLDRFVKEIVKPFQPDKTKKKYTKNGNSKTAPMIETNSGYYHVMVGGKLVKRRRISQDSIQPNKNTTKTQIHQDQRTGGIDDGLARKRKIWKEHIVIGTNQCLRLLENLDSNQCLGNDAALKTPTRSPRTMAKHSPSLVVIAKDIYPPTMCCAVPVLAKRLGIPLLVLPGKASLELGRALNAKRTSILVLCCGDDGAQSTNKNGKPGSTDDSAETGWQDKYISDSRAAMASFVSFIKDQIPQDTRGGV